MAIICVSILCLFLQLGFTAYNKYKDLSDYSNIITRLEEQNEKLEEQNEFLKNQFNRTVSNINTRTINIEDKVKDIEPYFERVDSKMGSIFTGIESAVITLQADYSRASDDIKNDLIILEKSMLIVEAKINSENEMISHFVSLFNSYNWQGKDDDVTRCFFNGIYWLSIMQESETAVIEDAYANASREFNRALDLNSQRNSGNEKNAIRLILQDYFRKLNKEYETKSLL